MNELTTEEKARYYDRAIEKAKDAFNDGTISSNTIAYLQDLFPELKDSENERIRKATLSGIKHLVIELGWDAIGDVDILDVEEWLEKQNTPAKLSEEEQNRFAKD